MTFEQIQDQTIRRFKSSLRTDLKEWINARYGELWAAEDWTFKKTTAQVTITSGSRTVTNLPADLRTPVILFDSDGGELCPLSPAEFLRTYQGDTGTGSPEHWTRIGDQIQVGPTPDTTATDFELLYQRALGYYPSTTMNETTTLPDATLTVTATGALPSSGQVWVGAGARLVTYTGKTPTTLTGCSGGDGTALTAGDLVVGTVAHPGLLAADTDVPLLPAETHMILVYLGQEAGAALESDPTVDSPATIAQKLYQAMRRDYLVDVRPALTAWPADTLDGGWA